jgi:hypothetical protein
MNIAAGAAETVGKWSRMSLMTRSDTRADLWRNQMLTADDISRIQGEIDAVDRAIAEEKGAEFDI